MKQILCVMISILMLITITACTTETPNSSADNTELQETDDSSELADGSNAVTEILVAYFSCTGTTEKLAKYAADYLNADLYEIWPADPYTDEDLAYYTNGRADQEQNDPDARPQINGQVEDMSKYQIVVIAYPIWHGQAPRIISSFLESYDFKIRQSYHSVPLILAVLEAVPLIWKNCVLIQPSGKRENDSIHRQQKVKLKIGLIALTSSRIIQNKRRQTRWEYLISKIKAYY